MNAPAQFQRILRRSETIVKLQMDEILRFWAEVACENLQSSGANLTKAQLLAQILQQYERRGDAMRYLNEQGKIGRGAVCRSHSLHCRSCQGRQTHAIQMVTHAAVCAEI